MARNAPTRKANSTGPRPPSEGRALAPVIPFSSFGRAKFVIPPPLAPMEARIGKALPQGDQWIYEPKWDGFRGLVFRRDGNIVIQSKAGQRLGRYFPELIDAFRQLPQKSFVLDGEIVILHDKQLFFDQLLQRIHPAATRILRLSQQTPASFVAFDLLAEGTEVYRERPLAERKRLLDGFFAGATEIEISPGVTLRQSPFTQNRAEAEQWLAQPFVGGLDGVVAKRADVPYLAGERSGMVKVKRIRSADCVIGGFRYAAKGGEVGSLLLGLYNREGLLDHIGFCSSFPMEFRKALKAQLLPLVEPPGFTGKAPGGPSRWSSERSGEWNPLRPQLVCEVRYDHFSGGRFRHGAKFLRWRPEKLPSQCTFDQLV